MRIATSAYGLLAMTQKIEPGSSDYGAARTPRDGCPYNGIDTSRPNQKGQVEITSVIARRAKPDVAISW